jgi:predicted type IV restriction endonuclease
VVLKDSRGRANNVASLKGTSNERLREQLVTQGVLEAHDGMLIFTRDHLFSSPSTAALALMGRSANGWQEWKNQQGKTLDEVKRQAVVFASTLTP